MRVGLIGCLLVLASGCKFPELPPVEEGDDDGGPDADLNVPQPLAVTVTGEGSVTSNPPGIACGSTCMADFDPLASVTLTPTPAATSVFEEWGGDCSGSGACTVTMDGAKTVSARFAQHGAVRWVNHISFVENESIDAIAVDGQGNVIVGGAVEPTGERDLFVAKYAPATGQVVWMRHLATPSPAGYEAQFGGMVIDAAGDIYLATSLQGNGTAVTYDPGKTAIGDLFHNIVVMRLSGTDGAVVWVKQWGGGSVDKPIAIAVSGSDLYVTGTTSSNPSNFDGQTIAGQVNQGFLLRASTATGTVAQVRVLPGVIRSMVVNGNNLLLGGTMSGTFSDGVCGTSATASGTDGLVMMYTGTTLACQWVKNFGSNTAGEDTVVSAVTSFANGSWLVGGTFEGSLSGLTPGGLGANGMFDAFAVRFALDGTHQWSFRYGGAGNEGINAVTATPDGNAILAGNFTGEITFGAHTVMGTNNVFVTRMSSSMTTPVHEWAVSLGGAESDSATAVGTAQDGSVFVNATFSGMTTVGATPLAAQSIDAWITSLVR
ncbi:MAG TPA: hypothetical protein VM261_16980 [Kofleriaceae bacterium]|nr:hypothetical protein [Kofleriaceae bacterium]